MITLLLYDYSHVSSQHRGRVIQCIVGLYKVTSPHLQPRLTPPPSNHNPTHHHLPTSNNAIPNPLRAPRNRTTNAPRNALYNCRARAPRRHRGIHLPCDAPRAPAGSLPAHLPAPLHRRAARLLRRSPRHDRGRRARRQDRGAEPRERSPPRRRVGEHPLRDPGGGAVLLVHAVFDAQARVLPLAQQVRGRRVESRRRRA